MRTRPTSPSDSASSQRSGHTSVLLHESIELLGLRPSDTVVDATLGGAGHSREIAKKLGSSGRLIGFDLDADAIGRAREALQGTSCTAEFIQGNFRDLAGELASRKVSSIDKALFDLGWSSYQLDAGRGFSFQTDEPLLMTYAKDPAPAVLTAAKIVNEWQESSLADVFYGWGGERYSRRIARAIVERRAKKPFSTARDLAEVIKASVPAAYRHGRIHPATKSFQALRIAVNDEMGALESGIAGAWSLLRPGGRIAVITFHSVEDRFVKGRFMQWEKDGDGKRILKKPLVPGRDELSKNPRARSAKLRVIEKLYTSYATDSIYT